MLRIKWVIEKVQNGQYYFSKHGDKERQNDNLFISDIEEAILNGRVLENYEDTGRGESCLVAGFADNGKPVHVICGASRDWLVIVTVYIPTFPKFKTPFERG